MGDKKKCAKCAKSKVCKVPNSDRKILQQLLSNKEGLRVSSIAKWTNLKPRTVYKRLGILRKQGLIENVFPIWKIVNGQSNFCVKLLKSDNIFELHNMSYVVKLLKKPKWWNKRKNYLIRVKDWQFTNNNFGKNNSNPFQQLKNDNFVVQCYPESLIIISRKRYYSNSPYKTISEAIEDVVDLLDWFCERFKFDFFCDGIPNIETRNNDFNRMNDALANHVRKKKGKFLIELDKRRKVWVDQSEPFGKEANYPNGQEILEKVTKDHLINKPMLNSELQDLVKQTAIQVKELTKNQEITSNNTKEFAVALNRHIPAYEGMGKNVGELKEEIRELKEIIRGMKK